MLISSQLSVYPVRTILGVPVTGSPFTLKVSGQPDASKVRVAGPGIRNGVITAFESDFTVYTQGAGAGELTVKIRGPKGRYCISLRCLVLLILSTSRGIV